MMSNDPKRELHATKYAEQSWRAFLASDANPVPAKYHHLRKMMKLAFRHGFASGRTLEQMDGIAKKIMADGDKRKSFFKVRAKVRKQDRVRA